ncbi:MAG: hypothetical protein AB7D37_03770 [Desulfovibrio sp.]
MPSKRRGKVTPKTVDVSYTFALGNLCDWSGELTYSVNDKAAEVLHGDQFASIPSIRMFPNLVTTTSKRINLGYKSEIRIHVMKNESRGESIGFIEKSKNDVLFVLGLPWSIANHIHLILISKMAKILTLTGTDVFRNCGSIYGISISKDYDTDI